MSLMRFGHLMARVFNAPLAIHPKKADVIVAALADRLGIARLDVTAPAPAAFFLDDDDFYAPGPTVTDPGYDLVEGVALIPVMGTLVQRLGSLRPYSGMTGYDGIREAFGAALAAGDVRGIVLHIDSPGGEVAGLFDLVDDIYAARGQKPIAAILDENAYSAAYALASSSDPGRLYVPRTGGTGSTGIIALHLDFSEALAKGGIKPTLFYKGARKPDGHPEIPLSDDAITAIQAEIDRLGAIFDQTVARNRGLAVDAVTATEAATFQGAAGVAVGFADQVMAAPAALQTFLAALA